MPDEYTYSLPGHSGTIELAVENKTIKRTLFPDESYRLEQTDSGYCITADDGTKFYFEDAEQRIAGTIPESAESTSYFLSRIETTKGGYFRFTYAREDYIDLSVVRDETEKYDIYHTKRITRIDSDFGYVTFDADDRYDRGGYRHTTIANDKKSKRIYKIELRDKKGNLIKGYELDNSDTFKLKDYIWEDSNDDWFNYRQKLSSITQYNAEGDSLPPYKFTYGYRFSKSRLQYSLVSNTDSEGNYDPYDSWTAKTGNQAYVDLLTTGDPRCWIGEESNSYPTGWSESSEAGNSETAKDYFCLDRIDYPTGAIDKFYYKPHWYTKINATKAFPEPRTQIQGRRLASKIRKSGDKSSYSQRTDYIYDLHDENYNASGPCSGVLTNPSIHNATYYTPETSNGGPYRDYLYLRASRISSGKPFNSFMGTPVCYTEVEEIELDESADTLSRTIHYYEPQIVAPPVNYLFIHSPNTVPDLIKIENKIYGNKSGYAFGMEGTNDNPHTYMAYPVGEFCNTAYVVDKPLKEVFIGKDNRIRSKKEYIYSVGDDNKCKKYGYKLVHPDNTDYTLISKSEYISRQNRLLETSTTTYYYDGNKCDSINEQYSMSYRKGRTGRTFYYRGDYYGGDKKDYETKLSSYYYPDDIQGVANSSLSSIAAVKELVDRNMIAEPIKTVVRHNGGNIVGGECKDYQMASGKPLLKSLYKLKNTVNYGGEPTIVSDTINYHADLYKEGEILEYDQDMNPVYVRLKNTQDRIYVWGYDGRYPIAVIDNMTYTRFQSLDNLKNRILQLQNLKKIQTAEEYSDLKNKNLAIRNLLPKDAHITTYTYDPYFGMTSETDDSNLGIIYTYDTFGRLTSKYDTDFNKTEEYNYHYKLQ